MPAKQLVLKVQMREDIRRIPFSIAEGTTAASCFQSIRSVVAKEYSLTDLSTMGLLYKSKEGDVCPLLESTVEPAIGLYEAGGVLPLVVTKQDPETSNVQAKRVQEEVVLPEPQSAKRKCARCDFCVGKMSPTHCCLACKAGHPKHGPNCQKILFDEAQDAAVAVAAAPAPAAPAPAAPAAAAAIGGKKCANCNFAVTGILPNHCCLCCSKWPGRKHGPACKRIAFTGAAAAEESENEAPPQQRAGGWADGVTDDEYGLKALQRMSATPAAAAAPRPRPGGRDGPGPMTPFQAWVEETAFQVGNLAHEVRNALRFWSSLVTPEPGKEPSEKMMLFKLADAQSGQLEGLMRQLAGRVRNVPVPMRPLGNLLPKAQQLMNQIWTNLSAMDSTLPATHQQRVEVEKLVTQEGSYLKSLQQALESEQVRLNPPPLAYSKVLFSQWSQEEASGMAAATAAISRGECLSAEQLLTLARLACNTSHELQNLAVPPRGGAGAPFMQSLRQIDNIAGQCENASRCIMVLAHRWKITNKPQPVAVIAARVAFLIQAEDQVGRLVKAATEAEKGSLVPAQAYQQTLGRLNKLCSSLVEAKMAVGLK